MPRLTVGVARPWPIAAVAKPAAAAARTPVDYFIFMFRWLAIKALVIPRFFFLEAMNVMQFIQR